MRILRPSSVMGLIRIELVLLGVDEGFEDEESSFLEDVDVFGLDEDEEEIDDGVLLFWLISLPSLSRRVDWLFELSGAAVRIESFFTWDFSLLLVFLMVFSDDDGLGAIAGEDDAKSIEDNELLSLIAADEFLSDDTFFPSVDLFNLLTAPSINAESSSIELCLFRSLDGNFSPCWLIFRCLATGCCC